MVALIAFLAAVQSPLPAPAPVAVVETTPGYGAQAQKDTRITVHFTAETETGMVVADTERRGMAFTFLMGQETVASFWHEAVKGLRERSERTVRVRASATGLALDGDPLLTVKLRIVKVAPL